MAERLTKHNETGWVLKLDDPQNDFEARQQLMSKFKFACEKLGKIEDLLEKYGVEDLEQLDIMLFCLSSETKFQLKQLQKLYKKYKIKNVEELEKKLADSDTWQKACELACEREDDCYVYDNIHRAYEFYQQAKKEGNDERKN